MWQSAVVLLSCLGFALVGFFGFDDGLSTWHLVAGGLSASAGGLGLRWLARDSRERFWQLLLFMALSTALICTGITILAVDPMPLVAALALSSMGVTALAGIRVSTTAGGVASGSMAPPRIG